MVSLDKNEWYVLRVTYQRELMAKAKLDELNIENFVPTHKVRVKGKNGKLTWETKVLLHNYIFVWEHFQNPTVPGVNIGQWCKKEDCWELLQKRFEAKMDKAGAK